MPAPFCIVCLVPALSVGERKPLHKFAHVSIAPWIKYYMKMVWHKAIRKDPHRELFLSIFKNIFKQNIVFFFKENRQSSVGTVYDMIAMIANVDARDARHKSSISKNKKKGT